MSTSALSIGVVGCGAIGRAILRAADDGTLGMGVAGVTSRSESSARDFLGTLNSPVPYLSLGELIEQADLIVEAAGGDVAPGLVKAAFDAGKGAMVISVGALIAHPELLDLARERGCRLLMPSGAIIGLDGIKAAAVGRIDHVVMESRKGPAALEGAPHVVNNGIDLESLEEETVIFSGSAREACIGFPANLNVAAAVSFAGVGPDRHHGADGRSAGPRAELSRHRGGGRVRPDAPASGEHPRGEPQDRTSDSDVDHPRASAGSRPGAPRHVARGDGYGVDLGGVAVLGGYRQRNDVAAHGQRHSQLRTITILLRTPMQTVASVYSSPRIITPVTRARNHRPTLTPPPRIAAGKRRSHPSVPTYAKPNNAAPPVMPPLARLPEKIFSREDMKRVFLKCWRSEDWRVRCVSALNAA